MTVAVATRRYASLRTNPAARILLAAVVLAAAGVLLMGSLVLNPGSRILGGFNDAAAGVRSYDVIDQAGKTPFTYRRDELNGAPEGVPAVRAIQFAAPIQPAVIWLLKEPLGFIGAINAFLLGGLLLTGVAMFMLLDRFRFGFLPSLFGAYLVTFNPWMYERVFSGHVAYAHGWVLILLLYTLIRLLGNRTVANAAIAGAAYGLCFLMASYTGLLATALVAAFVVVDLLTVRSWAERLWTGTLLLATSSVLVVFLLPGPIALLVDREAVTGTLTRSHEQLDRLSASPLNYVLPSPRHPLLGDVADSVRPEDIFHEKVVFVGYATIVLSVIAAVRLFRRRRRPDVPADQRDLLWLAAAAAPIALILSLGRTLSIGPVDVPLPAYLISEVTTFYRVYARLGFVVAIALAILAAWTLSGLRGRRYGTAAIVALIALAAFETFPARTEAVVMDEPPAYDVWLAEQPRGIVAHYPMMTDRVAAEQLTAREFYYQRFTGLPNFEIGSTQRRFTREGAIRLLARYISDPNAPRILAAEGVRYVVVHDDVYRQQFQEPPGGFGRDYRLLRRFDDVRVYELRAKPIELDPLIAENADVIALLWGAKQPGLTMTSEGYHDPEQYLNYSGKWRWMSQSGELILTNPGNSPTGVGIKGLSFSHRSEQLVELRDEHGRTLARTTIPTYLVELKLGPFVVPPGETRLTLYTTPGPTPLSYTDSRFASIFLSPLVAGPLADYSSSQLERP